MPTIWTLTPPNTGKDVEQQELSIVAAGHAKWCRRLEDSSAVSYEGKHSLTIWPRNTLSGSSPIDLKTCVWTNACTWTLADVYTTKMFFNRWKEPQTLAHLSSLPSCPIPWQIFWKTLLECCSSGLWWMVPAPGRAPTGLHWAIVIRPS